MVVRVLAIGVIAISVSLAIVLVSSGF